MLSILLVLVYNSIDCPVVPPPGFRQASSEDICAVFVSPAGSDSVLHRGVPQHSEVRDC